MSRVPPPPAQVAALSKDKGSGGSSSLHSQFSLPLAGMDRVVASSLGPISSRSTVSTVSIQATSAASLMLQRHRAMPEVPPPIVDPLDPFLLFPDGPSSTPIRPKTQEGAFSRRGTSSTLSARPMHLRRASTASSVDGGAFPVNLSALASHLLGEGPVDEADALRIVDSTRLLLKEESNILRLEEPLVVVGDIHGQFYDLMKLLEIGGAPGDKQYLFLGDYVDRGCFSVACVLYLFALKLCYPSSIHLLRGNHEGRHLTSYFSFKVECEKKYNRSAFYDACMVAFDALPLAATVGDRYFCVHGGLSPEVMHVDEISFLHRFREIPTAGAMCDLLWSDPHWDVENPVTGSAAEKVGSGNPNAYDFSTSCFFETEPIFTVNTARGCSYYFNFACLHQFIQTNNILCVIRAHEAQEEGYKLYRPHPQTHFPSMLSLFSAPNYCDSYDNKGAILCLQGGTMAIKQFFSSPHPYILPNFINGIQWSHPFVVAKLGEILSLILTLIGEDEDEEEEEHDEEDYMYDDDGGDEGEEDYTNQQYLGVRQTMTPRDAAMVIGRFAREVKQKQ